MACNCIGGNPCPCQRREPRAWTPPDAVDYGRPAPWAVEHPTFTAEDVRAVMARDLALWGSKTQLAKKLRLSKSWISAVLKGHKEPCGKLLKHYGFERQVRYVPVATVRGSRA